MSSFYLRDRVVLHRFFPHPVQGVVIDLWINHCRKMGQDFVSKYGHLDKLCVEYVANGTVNHTWVYSGDCKFL